MKLSDLLYYKNIVIQTHDNPDADAIASGYGLWLYFRLKGKKVRLIYGGSRPIQKSNLVLMVEHLQIPIEHCEALYEEPDLLLTVDCQYGERNAQKFAAKTIAVIDHHVAVADKLPELAEVRSTYGACATIIWDMLLEEGYDAAENDNLATALYYGLFMDTGKLQELHHPKDKDMRDALETRLNQTILVMLQNSNLSEEELKIAGKAMSGIDYHKSGHYALAMAQRCDPNILGVISDALIEVEGVGTCISYCVLDDGVKLSVRSCEKETRADELAAFVTAGMGSGGGHIRKSGGFIAKELLEKEYMRRYGTSCGNAWAEAAHAIMNARLEEYFADQDFFYAGTDDVPDLTREPVYEKQRLPQGYVKATDMYPVGTYVTVRMLEGDIPFVIKDDTYFIIGIKGEVYKNDEAYFLAHNDLVQERYQIVGDYAPTVHLAVNAAEFGDEMGSRPKNLQDYAMTCIPKSSSRIHAKQLTKRTKVFVPWSDSYMLGKPGDFLAARKENPKDIYVIAKDIMEISYKMV
ncbi:MAG: DHH family phosphoesterase [Lachnospiraceae bacterium]|nr:DHH family phosphoesterase [Lachnospiraceae bacterium]